MSFDTRARIARPLLRTNGGFLMADIVMADDGVRFEPESATTGPLGGAESAFIALAEALAARGHQVRVANRCAGARTVNGVAWTPIEQGVPERADLYIANRGDKLVPLAPAARRAAFWVHNPARYLMKWRYLSKLWGRRPVIVFLGSHHASTYPRWAPDGGRAVIPYGVAAPFLTADRGARIPGPRAIFTSNPLRSLDWLIDVWAGRIRPHASAAELHVYAGPATYGAVGAAKSTPMESVLARARATAGVVVHPPVAKAALVEALGTARVQLYRGDEGETFCSAVAEAQAAGVPGVVCDIACMRERVTDGSTGFVVADGDAASFTDRALTLLTDDGLWRRQSQAARDAARPFTWDAAAARFEALIQ
ncbi:MAG TPA: glycosyltransferase [Alphaproteobacteria bacterium]